MIYASKQGDGQMVEIEAYSCKAVGMPLNLSRNAYSAAEVTVKLLYSSAKDGVFRMRHIIPS
jgi:hypothetical protein